MESGIPPNSAGIQDFCSDTNAAVKFLFKRNRNPHSLAMFFGQFFVKSGVFQDFWTLAESSQHDPPDTARWNFCLCSKKPAPVGTKVKLRIFRNRWCFAVKMTAGFHTFWTRSFLISKIPKFQNSCLKGYSTYGFKQEFRNFGILEFYQVSFSKKEIRNLLLSPPGAKYRRNRLVGK